MNKTVEKLLVKADEIEANLEDANVELSNAIDALREKGEEANGNSDEYKTLKAVVSSIEAPKDGLAKAEDSIVIGKGSLKSNKDKRLIAKGNGYEVTFND